MKASKYNLFLEEKEYVLLYNLLSLALVKLESESAEIIKTILENKSDLQKLQSSELYKKLIYGKFLVEDDVDELKILKVRNMLGRFYKRSFGLTIAPTLNCNFKCTYCYQRIKKIDMSEQTQDDLIDFTKKALIDKILFGVTWYGGEPLLTEDIIFRLSEKFIEICNESKIPYSSGIITNGYLLDDRIIDKLENYQINNIQITMDGPKDIHNNRRKLENGDPTFDRILNNIKNLSNKTKVRIILRVNIDKENYARAPELLELLEKEGILKRINISFSPVLGYTETCSNYVDKCFTRKEYAELQIKFSREVLDKDPIIKKMPSPKLGYCSADSWANYAVDPEGLLYKCWTDIGEKEWSVGNIKDNIVTSKLYDYLGWDPFAYEECVKCLYLPICMGGCPRIRLAGKKPPEMCELWKYNLKEILKLFYLIHQREETQKSDIPNK
ncbi:MAG: radical SAM protein [Acidobacteriota bacterium]